MKERLIHYTMKDEEVKLACDIYKRYFSDSKEDLEKFFRSHKFVCDLNMPKTIYEDRERYIEVMKDSSEDSKVFSDCDHFRRICGIDIGHLGSMLRYFYLLDFKIENYAYRDPKTKELDLESVDKAQRVFIKEEYDKLKSELEETIHSRRWYEEKDDDNIYSNNYTSEIERCEECEKKLKQTIGEIEREKFIERDMPVQKISEFAKDFLIRPVPMPKTKSETNRDDR